MKLKVNPNLLSEYLKQISFRKHGDRFELEYGSYLMGNFPNCEKFWQMFVLPITERIEGYPNKISPKINFRININPEIEDIANTHYSMFVNFVFAHLHLEKRMESSLENIYTHLGTACDLAEAVVEKCYFLNLKLENKKSRLLQELTRDEFLEKAGELYDEKYSDWFEFYFQKGKHPYINLIPRLDILAEYLGKSSEARINYARYSQSIREFRNAIVHDMRIARIEVNGKYLIPKPKQIQNYRSWRKVVAVLNNQTKIDKDFAEQYQQAKEDLETLEQILNEIWDILIKNIESEFYAKERSTLREMFNIEFLADDISSVFNNKNELLGNPPQFPPPSGTFSTGGSIEYRRSDE